MAYKHIEEIDIFDTTIATKVFIGCNNNYYKVLLDAIKNEANRHGSKFGKIDRAEPLPQFLENRLALAFIYRRISYLHPYINDEELLKWSEDDIKSGYANTFLLSIIATLDAMGIRLYKDPYAYSLATDEDHTSTPLHLYKYNMSHNIDIKEEDLKEPNDILDTDKSVESPTINQSVKFDKNKKYIFFMVVFIAFFLLMIIMSSMPNERIDRSLSGIAIDRDVATIYTPPDVFANRPIGVSKNLSSDPVYGEQCHSDDLCLTSKTKNPGELLEKIAATIPIEKNKEYRVKITIEDITPYKEDY